MAVKHCLIALLALSSLSAETPAELKEKFPAILEPIQHAVIVPTVNARVVALPFKLGDSFHKGDILIQFEDAQIVANVKKTKAILHKAKEDYKVKKDMETDHLVSNLELLEAQANQATAEADYVAAVHLLEESQIRAPYDGKVANVSIRLFEIPVRDKPALEIFNDKTLIVNLLVPSRYLNKIKIGQKMYVRISDTNDIVEAVITRMSPIVNAASGTIKIEADIDNSKGTLKSGMASQAAFSPDAFDEKEGSFGQIMEEMKK